MKISKTIFSATVFVGILSLSQFANAQSISQKSSNISINGTSPMHDWTMSAKSSSFSGTVSGNSINNVKFSVPVKNLNSTKGSMMDNKAYKALKSDKNPSISFTATSIPIGNGNINGKMTIAGVTKNVSFPVSVVKKGAAYTIEGTETIEMSDFGVERPGFMGVKAGNQVTVKVSIVAQ